MKRALEIQRLLLDGKLDRAEAERRLGPVTEAWNSGRRLQCDTAGTPFLEAVLETLDTGEIIGVQLELRDAIVEQWSTLLDSVGDEPKEHLHRLDNPEGPLSFTLRSRRSLYPGVVILDVDQKLSTFTPGAFGERAPIVAAVTGIIIRRLDPW